MPKVGNLLGESLHKTKNPRGYILSVKINLKFDPKRGATARTFAILWLILRRQKENKNSLRIKKHSELSHRFLSGVIPLVWSKKNVKL